MEDNLYTLALSHYQKGEYEEAFYLLKVSDREETFSNKERVLLEACKKQISDQYYLLITNHIAQQEYDKAIKLQKNFLEKYNFDERIIRLTIPITDTKIKESDGYKSNKKTSIRFNLLLGIGTLLVLGIVILFVLIDDQNEDLIQNDENDTSYVEGNTEATPQLQNEEVYSATNQFDNIKGNKGNSEQEIIFEKLGNCLQADVSSSQCLSLYIKEDIAPTDEWSIGVNSLWLYNQKNRNLSLIARSGETIIEKTYQDETKTGPINAIDIAKVLPQNKLFISGCPDGRNVESYIYDIETKKAVFLYGSFHGITENELLIVEQYKMTIDKGRCPFLVFYDLNGNCVKSLPLD